MKKQNYGIEDISTLEGIAAIRHRPGMYIGSVEQEGVNHIFLEIVSNSIDEFMNGFCSYIDIKLESDKRLISIEDNGRGVPAGFRENGENVLESIFTKLHTGAKFAQDGTTGYNSSGGLNGIGSKATNALSSHFQVESKRGQKVHTATFEKGVLTGYTESKSRKGETGTRIEFIPDDTIFMTDAFLNISWVKKTLKELSLLNKGLSITLTVDNNEAETFLSENGLLDFLSHMSKDAGFLHTPIYFNRADSNMSIELAMKYIPSYSDSIRAYTNNIPNPEGGTHLTAIKTAWTAAINKFARDNSILKEKDENLSGADLSEGQVLVFNLNMPDPVFSGQSKHKLNSTNCRQFIFEAVGEEFNTYLNQNVMDAKEIIQKALQSRKAREAARKARDSVRGATPTRKKIVLPSKLTDATSKTRTDCELLIVEGNSAAGSAKDARNVKTQGVLPLKGKLINAEKNDISKLLKNEEIQTLVASLGCGIGTAFDFSKLRYHKIIITTDADVDGSHISILVLTFLYKYMKPLIDNGCVYVAMPPLYRAIRGSQYEYLADDEELTAYRKKYSKFELQRFKGLGEMNPKQLKETTLDPQTRTLKKMQINSEDELQKIISGLMGNDVDYRKDFISANGGKIGLNF